MTTHFRLSRQNLLPAAFIAIGLLAVWQLRQPLAGFLAWIGDRQAVAAEIQRLGVWGPLALFSLLVLQVFIAFIPGHALMLAGGYVYGYAVSLLITLTSTVLGSQIAFLVARRYGRAAVYRLAKVDAIQKWDRLAARQGALFYFFAFVLPIFPSDLMCYVAGLGTVTARRFFVANVLGRFVCAAFITLIGSNGLHMPAAFWIASLLVVAGLYGAWRLYSRKMDRQAEIPA
jgi:uncharacterized membrane protein YdjX (TVP38/TMEM64 family)